MRVLFGSKVANLEELREFTEIAHRRGQHGQAYTVVREVYLDNTDFTTFANDFFENQPWITKEDGGVNQQGQVRCIRVINSDTGEKVLVNNEGYSYCRPSTGCFFYMQNQRKPLLLPVFRVIYVSNQNTGGVMDGTQRNCSSLK